MKLTLSMSILPSVIGHYGDPSVLAAGVLGTLLTSAFWRGVVLHSVRIIDLIILSCFVALGVRIGGFGVILLAFPQFPRILALSTHLRTSTLPTHTLSFIPHTLSLLRYSHLRGSTHRLCSIHPSTTNSVSNWHDLDRLIAFSLHHYCMWIFIWLITNRRKWSSVSCVRDRHQNDLI